jgi:hypothetical protein
LFQVKIAGNRIHLSEIEVVLQRFCDCREPVAVFLEETSEIIVFVQLSETPINLSRNFLTNYLPSYAVPTKFITVNEFPIMVSGKVDRKKLMNSVNTYAKDKNESENDDLLKSALKDIGMSADNLDQNFFNAGGSSLNAILLVSKLHQAGFNNLTVDRLMKMESLEEIRLLRNINVDDPCPFFDKNNHYRTIPLENVDKHDAMRIISESFTELGEIDELVHHNLPELKIECKQEWLSILGHHWSDYIAAGLSFGVLTETEELVGVSISTNLNDESPINLDTVPRLTPIFNMIEAAECKLLEEIHSKNPHVQRIMHGFLAAVNLDVEIAKRVPIMYFIEQCVHDLAMSNGFDAILTANAGSVTKQISEYILKYEYTWVVHANKQLDSSGQPIFLNALDHHTLNINAKLL